MAGKIRELRARFTQGEISPRLHSNEDIELYQAGVALCENWIVMPHGGLIRRPGTRFVAPAKHADKKCRLITFEYSTIDTYVIEVGHLYMRFYRQFGQIVSASVAYELVTTFTEDQIFGLAFTQTENSMLIVHKDHAPKELKRTGHTNWTLTDITFTSKPTEWTAGNYPQRVSFYQQRSVYASTPNQPQAFWLSKTGAPKVMTLGTDDDSAIKLTITAGQVNNIMWVVEGRALMIGTSGTTRTLSGSGISEAITSKSLLNRRHTSDGSSDVPPIQTGESALYLSRNRRKLREFAYSFEKDSFESPDITLASEHITGTGITAMDHTQDPDSIIWMLREDGQLVGLTYEKSQGVYAYHRHKIGGSTENYSWGEVESITAAFEGDREVLWMVVKRRVNGADVRHIEYMEAVFDNQATAKEDSFFVDSGITYDGAEAATISGFDHLVGEDVDILYDGKVLPQTTVAGDGTVTLPNERKGSKITAGLHYESLMLPLSPIVATQAGTGQGKKRRVVSMGLQVMDTGTIEAGDDLADMQEYTFRDGSVPFGETPPLKTGYIEVDPENGWNDTGQLYIRASQPLPATIRALITEVEAEG